MIISTFAVIISFFVVLFVFNYHSNFVVVGYLLFSYFFIIPTFVGIIVMICAAR